MSYRSTCLYVCVYVCVIHVVVCWCGLKEFDVCVCDLAV